MQYRPAARALSRSRPLVCLALGLLAAGCSTTIVRHKVEKKAEQKLQTALGPADSYKVRITGTRDSELVRGRARQVEVDGTKIRARGQMLIDSMRLTAEDLRYTGEEPYYVTVARTDLELEFTDTALNEYLAKYEKKYDPVLHFHPDRVDVKMLYPFLGKPTPISGSGRLVVEEATRLVFKADKVDLSFLNKPGFGEKFVEDRINPLLDMSEIQFPARLESVTVMEGRIRAHGSASIPRDLKN
jgi:hypothetical protein